MPDVLLIQPPIRDFYLTAKRTIPYGLTCIAAALTENGFTVDLFDGLATSKSRVCDLPSEMDYLHKYYGRHDRSPFALFHSYRHYGYGFDFIGQKAKESGAYLVGISSLFTPYMQEAIQTAESVKTYHPNCQVVVGGHHPSAMPQSVMESDAVDFAIRGEGEVAMPLLARAIAEGGDYRTIPGLVFRHNQGRLHANPPAQMTSLNGYPLPAAHLLHHRFYRRHKKASMVIVATRGCPMKCSYCSVGAQSYLRFRRRSVESVIAEIEHAKNRYDVGFIDFEDENLSLNRQWFLKLLREIERNFGTGRLELRAMNGLYPPTLDNEVLRAMKAAGFKTLNLSLGSTSTKQLNRFNRANVQPAFERALKLAEDHGLNAVGYLICAAPFQSADDSIADLLYLAQRRVVVGVSIFYPAPGSEDFELCKKLKILPDHFTCMRSSALPLAHTTSRKEAVTLLRLARILNFMKSLLDKGESIPSASRDKIIINDPSDRVKTGRQLLAKFLDDGKIRGISPDGEVFEHLVSESLCRKFLAGLAATSVRGAI